MGSITLAVRQQSLQSQLNDDQLRSMQLKATQRRYTNLASVLKSGINLSPDALASVGGELFGDALDSMAYARDYAAQTADDQLDPYVAAFEDLTQEQYMTSGLANQAALYTDENGNLVTDIAWNRFYEEALKEYVEQVIMPELNEIDKEFQEQLTALETQIMQEEQELEAVKQSKEQAIQREQIKLG